MNRIGPIPRLAAVTLVLGTISCGERNAPEQRSAAPVAPVESPPAAGVRMIRYAGKLVTPNYEATIAYEIAEGTVDFDGVRYRGVSKRSGNRIELVGSTWFRRDADGTPLQHYGYVFRNADTTYYVRRLDLDTGQLTVVRGENEVLIDETGTWTALPVDAVDAAEQVTG